MLQPIQDHPSFVRRQSLLRPHALVAAMLSVSLLCTGCTSAKYKKVSTKDAAVPPAPINAQLGTDPVATTLNTVIVYKGPGSWKKEAYWDEYAFTLRNNSTSPVTISSAALVDYTGVTHASGINPWALEKQSKSLEKQYADAGVAFVRYAGPVAALGAITVGATYAAANAAVMGGTAAGGTAATSTVPVLIPVYLVAVVSINQVRKHGIEHEFHQRRLQFPLVLNPGEERSGSLFFPMVPSPQSLELSWDQSAAHGTTQLPLTMLSGLHLNPAKEKSVAQAASAAADSAGN